MTDPAKAIRIGTMIKASEPGAHERIAAIADLGFESFEPFFWQTTNGQDLAEMGKRSLDAIGNRDITISTIGVFGNPLEDKPRRPHDALGVEGLRSTTPTISAPPASPASPAASAASR